MVLTGTDGEAAVTGEPVGLTGAFPLGAGAPLVMAGEVSSETEAVAMQAEKTWVLEVASCGLSDYDVLVDFTVPNLLTPGEKKRVEHQVRRQIQN